MYSNEHIYFIFYFLSTRKCVVCEIILSLEIDYWNSFFFSFMVEFCYLDFSTELELNYCHM